MHNSSEISLNFARTQYTLCDCRNMLLSSLTNWWSCFAGDDSRSTRLAEWSEWTAASTSTTRRRKSDDRFSLVLAVRFDGRSRRLLHSRRSCLGRRPQVLYRSWWSDRAVYSSWKYETLQDVNFRDVELPHGTRTRR